MLGRCTPEPPPTPLNFDVQNRAIEPTSMYEGPLALAATLGSGGVVAIR